jgi:ABC-2 type transport system ATP-binding protein
MQPPAIQVEFLSKTYTLPWSRRRVEALTNLTLRIPRGTSFGLLGPNGAGKTTFVKILLGLARPTSGRVNLFGESIGPYLLRQRVGYLPEGGSFPNYHTGRSLLELHGRLAGLLGTALNKRVEEILDLVAMREWEHVSLSRYSKGMVQRIGLGQALLGNPDLLVLDEPTDGVDPVGRALVREVLERLNQNGVTIFINSHILAEVELFCRRVAILHRGKVVLDGEVTDLTQGAGYHLRWTSPQPVIAHATRTEQDGCWSATFPDVESLNAAIDTLRQHAALIDRVERRQTSLEQVFLRAVRGEDVLPATSGGLQ